MPLNEHYICNIHLMCDSCPNHHEIVQKTRGNAIKEAREKGWKIILGVKPERKHMCFCPNCSVKPAVAAL